MRFLPAKLVFSTFLLLPLIAHAQNFENNTHKTTFGITGQVQNIPHLNDSFLIGFAILPGDQTTSPRFDVSYNRQLTPNLNGGIGVGFTWYNDPLSLLPLFITLKYRLLQTSVFPFISLKTGYNFSLLTDTNTLVDHHNGGLLFNPAIGIQFPFKNEAALYITGGYNIDHASFSYKWGNVHQITTDITYKRFMIGVGFVF